MDTKKKIKKLEVKILKILFLKVSEYFHILRYKSFIYKHTLKKFQVKLYKSRVLD